MTTDVRRLGAAALGLSLALSTALVPRPAAAACENVDRDSEAAAFRQGLQRYRAGDAAGAVEIWKGLLETLGQSCGWKVLYNLGRAYEKLGDPTRAIERYSAFVAAANERKLDAREARLARDARASIAALKARYGAIHVAPPPSGVVLVRLGAGDPQPAGFTVYVVPGTHSIELFARTARATTRTVTVRAGHVTELTIPTSTDSAPVRADLPRELPAPQAREFPTLLVAVGSGLTLAGVGASVFFYTQQASKRDEAEALSRSDADYARLRDEHGDTRDVYHVSLVVTGAFAAATAAVVVVHLLGSDDAPVRARASVSPAAANLAVTARF